MSSISLYARDIDNSASRMVDSKKELYGIDPIIKTVKKGIYASLPTLLFFTNPLYHLSGFAATLTNRLLDNYSTYKMAKQFERKEFFEYGLDKIYYETNPVIGKHPTRKDMLNGKALLVDSLGLLFGTIIPPFGYGMLLASYRIYKNNMAVARSMEKAIEIGDEVKEKIDSGIPEEDIREWLKDLAEIKR